MNATTLIGLAGSLILVAGAAYPDRRTGHPARSIKNWLFATGGATMLIYSILQYATGGPIFFVFLEVLVMIASVFMLLNTPDTVDAPVIAAAGLGLIAWSLFLFQDARTILFVLGLCGVGIGYALDTGTTKREAALTAGSILIAVFSYLEANWIFFWLNLFFAMFSGYYFFRMSKKRVK